MLAEKQDFALRSRSLLFASGSGESFDALPLSFTLDGKTIHGIPAAFCRTFRRESTDTNITRRTWTGTDSENGLTVAVTSWEYRDFPVVEWLAEFTNGGKTDTPIVSDIALGGEIAGEFDAFVHGNGDTCRDDGYEWFRDALPDAPMTITPADGTSCNGAFPYMKLVYADFVVRAAVGWPHIWKATVTRTSRGAAFSCGQARCRMKIRPGETMRTPRLTLMISAGDEGRSMNLWRSWYLRHILPREYGQPIGPAMCLHYWGCEGKPEHTAATEENQVRGIETYVRRGLTPDIWWIDAGWYKCDYNWPLTGTWKPDPERFPHGLGPIGEACGRVGARFLLWFEPERVVEGTEIAREHPEWCLPTGREGDSNRLFDLGNPEARRWLTDRIDSIIKEGHIRVYRQDFNFDPKPCWLLAEAEDRIGAMENLHVQGYLAYWDALIDRNPGLWIDSCASGGRRNDLETMRRAVPLHYTDVGYGEHTIKQKQFRELFEWIPYFRSHNMSWDRKYVEKELGREWVENDEFSFQCAMAPAVTYMTWWDADDEQYARTIAAEKIWRRAAQMMLRGDYEPLTECRKDPGDWYAMRFDCGEEGFVQFIRNRASEENRFSVPFRAIPGKTYVFDNSTDGTVFERTSDELTRDGLGISLPKRTGVVLFYRVK
ncbi:MAG: alpha-galactosidase [Clostridiales bacterium]|nr:alpha-galactosidase [Clostridiales bacterium]